MSSIQETRHTANLLSLPAGPTPRKGDPLSSLRSGSGKNGFSGDSEHIHQAFSVVFQSFFKGTAPEDLTYHSTESNPLESLEEALRPWNLHCVQVPDTTVEQAQQLFIQTHGVLLALGITSCVDGQQVPHLGLVKSWGRRAGLNPEDPVTYPLQLLDPATDEYVTLQEASLEGLWHIGKEQHHLFVIFRGEQIPPELDSFPVIIPKQS
jgi:hypothetical protein